MNHTMASLCDVCPPRYYCVNKDRADPCPSGRYCPGNTGKLAIAGLNWTFTIIKYLHVDSKLNLLKCDRIQHGTMP